MGKKRIIKKGASGVDQALKARALGRLPKKKLSFGILTIFSTYNNTLISLADEKGDVVLSSSAGALGFRGTRKSTPYAASKVAEFMGERAKMIGVSEVEIKVKGIGAGRESALRAFASKGFDIKFIKDITPTPHNGPKPPKVRRV